MKVKKITHIYTEACQWRGFMDHELEDFLSEIETIRAFEMMASEMLEIRTPTKIIRIPKFCWIVWDIESDDLVILSPNRFKRLYEESYEKTTL